MTKARSPIPHPPRVWVSKNSHRLVSGGIAPDAGFVEFQDSSEYLSLSEAEDMVREAVAKTWNDAVDLRAATNSVTEFIAGAKAARGGE